MTKLSMYFGGLLLALLLIERRGMHNNGRTSLLMVARWTPGIMVISTDIETVFAKAERT